MSTVQKRTFSLAEEQAEFIDAKVASGDYASGSEVVRAGIRALKEQDEAIERWLWEKVAPAYDELKANPSLGMPLEDAIADIQARLTERFKDRK